MARNAKGFTADDDALLAELGVEAETKKASKLSPQEERVIAGFEAIQRFVEQHGHHPRHGEDKDIFERLYAVRLERLRSLEACQALLASLDHQGLLNDASASQVDPVESMSDEALLAELEVATANDISELRHVRSNAAKRTAEAIADRKPCKDFAAFKTLFKQLRSELSSGLRVTRPFGRYATIEVGHWFILDGQTAYVAEEGEEFDSPQGRKDARLRVIFSNGTESNLLRLSLARALYKDATARRITDPDMGPMFHDKEFSDKGFSNKGFSNKEFAEKALDDNLFSDSLEAGDLESGTIYVLRSLSDNPYVAEHRALIHKIGVTGGKVETRIAKAEHDATYLLAKVEVVASYTLAGINRVRMERLFHRLFSPARLNITIHDRFGHPVQPEEWFLVPLFVIDEAVARIKDGSITGYIYDPKTAQLVSQHEQAK